MDEQDNHYLELNIQNREVKYIIRTKILKWFEEKVKRYMFIKIKINISNQFINVFF
ncbi:hypothetical protein psyc5s11_16070 [Clostridium gelidum]|uniref:Uncharacterized protein n=1 Tax=Clostridium gelidum TaxID=704125 RepID=A0ABM7T3U1_9CLOT|nr:hypothetical protein psyc5s11_16070 [Clostridium gelidum]